MRSVQNGLARSILGVAALLLWFAGVSNAQSPVTVSVDPAAAGTIIPDDFTGLSFEMHAMLPDAEKGGQRIFRGDNQPLIALFKQLGLKNIRVGGNTADKPEVPVPGEADIDSLFAFAKAAGARVIYTLRLRGDYTPESAAKVAKYVQEHYRSDLICFAIGNEPNVYAKEYPAYRDLFNRYLAAVTAPGLVPDAQFCGPSTTPGRGIWARDFANEFGSSGRVKFISQHSYPGGSAKKVTDVVSGRDKLLEPAINASYQKMYDTFVPAAKANKLPYRLEETNSYFNGGAKDVSNTQGAALWALDYMHWWAAHDAAGLNFHTGDNVAAGETLLPCWYATYWTAPDGYKVHPIGHAIKAFDLAGHGKVTPAKVTTSDELNLTAYAVAGSDGNLYVTLINREHGDKARAATVTLTTGSDQPRGEMMLLQSPNNDVAATDGITLGGAQIKNDATWNGKWTPLPAPESPGHFKIELPACTAAIVKLGR